MSKDDNSNNLAATGMMLGMLGMNGGKVELTESHKEADKACISALCSMAETIEKMNALIKSAEDPDEFGYENIEDMAERMTSMASSMSTLRMSIGLGNMRSPMSAGMS